MDHPNCEHMREQVAALRADMAAAEKEHESFRRRLHEHDEGLKQLTELTIAINGMAKSISDLAGSMDKMEKRLTAIEAQPGENWKKMAFEVLKYIVLGVIGAIVLKNL